MSRSAAAAAVAPGASAGRAAPNAAPASPAGRRAVAAEDRDEFPPTCTVVATQHVRRQPPPPPVRRTAPLTHTNSAPPAAPHPEPGPSGAHARVTFAEPASAAADQVYPGYPLFYWGKKVHLSTS